VSIISAEVTRALEQVSQIDLSPINKKLQFEDPAFWTDELIAETEANYRRFLALNLLYPSETLSVNKTLDDYWHQHILDTRKYAVDCEKVFGFFLHHYPYFGIEGGEERQQNIEAFAVTQQLWEEAFGVPLVGAPKLTLDKILGTYQPEPTDISPKPVYAFPQACKSGQHCNKAIVPALINPVINPLIRPPITQPPRPASP
jgi:hypothetical protein